MIRRVERWQIGKETTGKDVRASERKCEWVPRVANTTCCVGKNDDIILSHNVLGAMYIYIITHIIPSPLTMALEKVPRAIEKTTIDPVIFLRDHPLCSLSLLSCSSPLAHRK